MSDLNKLGLAEARDALRKGETTSVELTKACLSAIDKADALNAFVRVITADDQDDAGDFETDTDGYTRWDAGVDYRFDLYGDTELLTFVKWKNIGDEEIRLSTSFLRNYAPQAGESIEAGIRFSF